MFLNPNDNESEKDDFFNTPVDTPKPKVKKEPPLKPDNPDYYEIDDEWEHIRPTSDSWKIWAWVAAFGIFVGILIAIYIRYVTPYSEGEIQYGYVEKIARRGNVFKTFEGVMLPYRSLADTITPYEGDIVFSARDAHVAARLLRLQKANLPARVEMSVYHATLPWRGESRIVITAADTADVTKIFPPTSGRDTIPHGF